MGTGKSTWVTMLIKSTPNNRYIVVLPMLTELRRYEQALHGIDRLVCLWDGTQKKNRFDEALTHANIILITHALYEEYLNDVSFEILEKGQWNLILDEVITAFEQVKLDHTSIRGLVDIGAIIPKPVSDTIEKYVPNKTTYQYHEKSSDYMIDQSKKAFLKEALAKDVFGISTGKDNQERRYYTFCLREERLTPFQSIRILTYPFKNTDLYYWFKIKQIRVSHLELLRLDDTDSLNDFSLIPHSGSYSGSSFTDLIELVDTPKRSMGKKYGESWNDFSATSMREFFAPAAKSKINIEIQKEVRNSLVTLFRNRRKTMVTPEEFMFTCKKDSIPAFQDSKNRLTKDFIGEETFVPFNERATNSRGHKNYLAYLYNAFPFPSVVKAIEAHGIQYDQDRYSLYILIQWIWRSAIRHGERIQIYIPSVRMRNILEKWLNS